MTKQCKYPGCHQKASKTWALVPLCPHHFFEIHDETQRYYHGRNDMKVTYEEREHYSQIVYLTPWKRMR